MKDIISVIYHDNCPDGFTSAYIARKYFGSENNLIDYIPWNYNQGIPELDERTRDIYILDFSFSYDEMIGLKQKYNNVVLLDHHKTAQEELSNLDGCIINKDESGASLTWQYFFDYRTMPRFIRYVRDRDLWRWMEYASREVSAYISMFSFSFYNWENIENCIENEFNSVVTQGSAILSMKNKMVADLVNRNYHVKDVGDYKVVSVNSPVLQSEIGEYILNHNFDTEFAAVYYEDGVYTNWSLRSRKDFDVSIVAKSLGGGGHAQAAGFRKKIDSNE